ncbi:MAG: DNA mismatch repair endonuclease MutL [Desulfobacteraceae bacterium]|jgi:DNA mismatch repair protein MutL
MARIRILPEILSNKIAAGEVVERPAAVVKELVENSLDAGSRRVSIEIGQGGRSLIRVADDGSGMSRDDALLALERYATSKIFKDQDLFAIRSLGFRGEALPSIASVSRFTLISREAHADTATEITVEGGRIQKVVETGAPPGTMVSVRQLFFNTPARRKFLKTVATEMGHIADAVANIAMGWPEVQFKLTHNAKTVKSWPPAAAPLDRVADILGRELQPALQAFQFDHGHAQGHGWVASARVTRSTSRGIFVYVNGRFVRDRVVQHALFEGFRGRLMKGQFPVGVLFLNVPFDQVDVNVHPTKHEIRFAQPKAVHDVIAAAVARALQGADTPRWQPPTAAPPAVRQPPPPADGTPTAEKTVAEPRPTFGQPPPAAASEPAPGAPPDLTSPAASASAGAAAAPVRQADLWQARRFGSLRVIGQLHDTYILCESPQGLILIDQHAAHERIFFEALKARSAGRSSQPSQRLLVPETVELGFRESQLLEGLLPRLAALGLEIEPFGGNTFAVKAVPAMLAGGEIRPLVTALVEKMAETGLAPDVAAALDDCLMVIACHGAIRAHQALSVPQLQSLLAQLDACDNPSHCPHGRPTWIQWSVRFLEKAFKRLV